MKKINKFLSCLGSFLFTVFLGIVGSKVNAHKFKIVFIGDAGVGKTSIINRFVNNQFNRNIQSTVGIGSFSIPVTTSGGEDVALEVYDTAGQEKFRAFNPICFRDSDLAILVSDLSDPTSLTDQSIGEHIGLYNSQCFNNPIFLIANKSDLVNETTRNEIVSTLEQNYKKSGQVTEVFYASAKSGKNINEIFSSIAQYLCDNCDFNSVPQTKGRHTHALQITDEIDSTAKKKACCKS